MKRKKIPSATALRRVFILVNHIEKFFSTAGRRLSKNSRSRISIHLGANIISWKNIVKFETSCVYKTGNIELVGWRKIKNYGMKKTTTKNKNMFVNSSSSWNFRWISIRCWRKCWFFNLSGTVYVNISQQPQSKWILSLAGKD